MILCVPRKYVNQENSACMYACIQDKPPLLSIPKSSISRDKKRLADSSTSTSTGRTREGLESWLVLILMKEVWFVATRPKKLARPTAFVSYGLISYTDKIDIVCALNVWVLYGFSMIFAGRGKGGVSCY